MKASDHMAVTSDVKRSEPGRFFVYALLDPALAPDKTESSQQEAWYYLKI
jgi:hypothetical protein